MSEVVADHPAYLDQSSEEDTGPIGAPDPEARIQKAIHVKDRTFIIALGIVSLLYLSVFGVHLATGTGPRKGQVDEPRTITVDLVEMPNKDAAEKKSQTGDTQTSSLRSPQPPQTPQEAQEGTEAEQPKPAPENVKEEQKVTKTEPQPTPPKAPPVSLEDFDVSMDSVAKDFEDQMSELRRQRKERREAGGGDPRQFSAAAAGKQSEYSKGVIAALSKTKPIAYFKRGEVVIGFEISKDGKLKFIRIMRSSGDKEMDETAVTAITRARFQRPPPDVPDSDRFYVITYVFD